MTKLALNIFKAHFCKYLENFPSPPKKIPNSLSGKFLPQQDGVEKKIEYFFGEIKHFIAGIRAGVVIDVLTINEAGPVICCLSLSA